MAGAATSQQTAAVPAKAPGAFKLSVFDVDADDCPERSQTGVIAEQEVRRVHRAYILLLLWRLR